MTEQEHHEMVQRLEKSHGVMDLHISFNPAVSLQDAENFWDEILSGILSGKIESSSPSTLTVKQSL